MSGEIIAAPRGVLTVYWPPGHEIACSEEIWPYPDVGFACHPDRWRRMSPTETEECARAGKLPLRPGAARFWVRR